jgi:acetyl-CoA acetyltransferase
MDRNKVAILGVGMTRFGMNYETHHSVMGRDAGLAALDDAGISFKDIDAVYVGHIFLTPMAGVRTVKELGLTGVPIQRIENASATGTCALREAYMAVAAGWYDRVLVLGFDKMTNVMGAMPNPQDMDEAILPAGFFAMWATRRMHERGTKPEHLAKIAAKNWNYGALNPFAQRQPKEPVTPEKVLGAKMVAWPLTAMMSCPIGDGGAAAVVCRADLAKKYQPDRPVITIAASHLGSEKYERGHLFMGPVVGPAQMSRDAAKDLWEQSGMGPEDIDLVQVHDAFAIEELEYYELLGFCREGEAEKAIEEGWFGPGGRTPFSTDGGLIARGHPGGPTGLAQIWETTLQLRGEAGKRQVPNARAGLCHMMGGGSVCAAHILKRE